MPIDRDGDGPPLRRQELNKAPQSSGDGRADLRATPFTDDVFNDDYHGRRPRRSEEGRSFSVIVGVVLGLVVAGGAGWYFFRDGGDLAVATGSPGFIKADPSPYKVRPESPGGMQVENQDKLVYDRVAKGNAPSRVENLMPPAEEPKAPPMKAPEPAPAAEAPKPAPEPAKVEAAKVEPAKSEPVQAEPAKPEPAKAEVAVAEPPKAEAPAPAAAKAPAKPEVDPLAAAVAAATGGRTSATGPINVGPDAAKPNAAPPAETPAAAPAETQVAAVPSPVPAAAAGGAFHIQLASVLSEAAAQAEWKRIASKNKTLLGAYQPLITKADLGERGVFYRLRAGPLADKAAADALCASLEEAKVGCIVIRP